MTVGLQKRASIDDCQRVEKLTLITPGKSFASLKNNISKLSSKIQESKEFQQMMSGIDLIEILGFQYILQAFFIDMGWQPKIGDSVTLSNFMREYQIRRTHRKLFQTLLERLEHFGILSSEEKTDVNGNAAWTVSKLPPSPAAITTQIKNIQTQLLEFPDCTTEVEFFNQCGANLSTVLRGKRSGLDILFPAETAYEFQFGAQEFYLNSKLMEFTKTVYITDGILESVRQLVADGQNTIRILEIGAGTGSTTIPLLKQLTAAAESLSFEIEYTFTDVSNFFVGKSKQKIEKMFPTVKFEFESLDIEQGIENQKFFNGQLYDVVMAADVFHATQYLDDTLTHTREYLKPGGNLVLGEVFMPSIFLDISFGLTEGWWRFADEIRSPNSPLITDAKWEELMKMSGFSDTFSARSGAYGVVFAVADSSA